MTDALLHAEVGTVSVSVYTEGSPGMLHMEFHTHPSRESQIG